MPTVGSMALVAAVLALAACPGGSDKGGGSEQKSAGCDQHASKVRSLYEGADLDTGKGQGAAALRKDLVDANVHMVLADCRSDPERFAPCLAKASSVEEVESSCLVPLDERGEVEQRAFGPGARAQ